jgi:hypothetical protein
VAVRRRTHPLRALALLGAGAVAIHQLRYAIAYGNAAPQELAVHNHGYFELALPAVATVFVLALAAVLIRIARGRAAAPHRRTSLTALWLCCALALGTIYGVQETLEGAGALAGGGWIGFALAFPAGLLVALASRGADAAELRLHPVALRIQVVRTARLRITAEAPRLRIAATRLGARAPPKSCVV